MEPRDSGGAEDTASFSYGAYTFWLVEGLTLVGSWGLYSVILDANTGKKDWGPEEWLSLVYFVSYSLHLGGVSVAFLAGLVNFRTAMKVYRACLSIINGSEDDIVQIIHPVAERLFQPVSERIPPVSEKVDDLKTDLTCNVLQNQRLA